MCINTLHDNLCSHHTLKEKTGDYWGLIDTSVIAIYCWKGNDGRRRFCHSLSCWIMSPLLDWPITFVGYTKSYKATPKSLGPTVPAQIH